MSNEPTTPPDWAGQKLKIELFIIFVLSVVVYTFSANFDMLESFSDFSERHEAWELDEIVSVSIFLVFALAFLALQMWQAARKERNKAVARSKELEKALADIRQLRGILPICWVCKKIRDDEGYWQQVEAYVHDHSDAEFSHSICPDCIKKLCPEIAEKKQQMNPDTAPAPEHVSPPKE